MSVFVDVHYTKTLKYFLRAAETLEPQMIKEIEKMIPLNSSTFVIADNIYRLFLKI